MSVTEVSSFDFLNSLQNNYVLPAFTGCGKVAVAAKNVFLGSACAVLGTVFKGAGMITTSTLPPAVGAIALWVSMDSIKYLSRVSRSDFWFSPDIMIRERGTVLFSVAGAIALASMADNIASVVKQTSSYFYIKRDEYLNA